MLVPRDVELPLKRTVEEDFTLEVYLDISMRQSLYEEMVEVKWGTVSGEDRVWLPNDDRQVLIKCTTFVLICFGVDTFISLSCLSSL